MSNKKSSDKNLLQIALITAIVSLINSLITLIEKIIETFNK